MASQKEELKESRRRHLNWIIVGLLVTVVTVLSLPTFTYFPTENLKPGHPSPRTYQVDQRYRVKDVERTQSRRHDGLSKITPQFVLEKGAISHALDSLRNKIASFRKNPPQGLPSGETGWNRTEKIASLIAESLLEQGIIRDKSLFNRFKYQDTALLIEHGSRQKKTSANVKRREVKVETLRKSFIDYGNVKDKVRQILDDLYPDYPHTELIVRLLDESLRPTVSFNQEKFRRQIKEVKKSTEPYFVTYNQGEVLLKKGERVTKKHINLLRRLNSKQFHYQLTKGGASFGIITAAILFFYFYVREFNPDLLYQHKKLILLSILTVLFVATAKIVELLQVNLPPAIEYAIPLAAPVMLVTLMVSEGVAFLFSVFLALIISTFFAMNLELFAMLVLGAFTGILSIRNVERRGELLRGGLLVGLVQTVIVLCLFTLRTGDPLSTRAGAHLFWGAINGIIIVPFTVLGLLPFLEDGFDITTNFRLLELGDLNRPLLQYLFRKAPGTFQHSVMLSSLCEQTARAIGANALMVRVGCYYHDIGKAETPEYFIENQDENKNPHDELKPTLSASILKAHVKRGSQIARESGLPKEIVDLIEQHHGTTLIKTFYHDALKKTENEINKEEFQYPGPLPQTREAGLCMLGDAVEAACRGLEDPTPQTINERISNIVRDKFIEGQLNECDLTLRDLNIIIDSFTRFMTSVYHRRIEYPEAESPQEVEEHVQELQTGETPVG